MRTRILFGPFQDPNIARHVNGQGIWHYTCTILFQGLLDLKFKVRSPVYEESWTVVSLQGDRTTRYLGNIFFFFSCKIIRTLSTTCVTYFNTSVTFNTSETTTNV
jgi:hypothetical protein